ncbi:unnamed protein product [Brassica rapa subsp. trilocularis]
MCKCRSHGTFPLFGLQSSHLNICYYHQDLHRRPLRPGSRPRFCSDRRALLLIEAWLLPRRPGIGRALQRHPFSGLVDSAVGHRNPASGSSRIASSAYQKWPTWSSRFRGMAQQSSHPSFAPIPKSDERFARQYRCGPPPEFPLASPRSGIVHHLSGPDRHAHTRTLLRKSRSVGCAPVRDPANQLPCALRDASLAPIRFPPDNFKHSLTLFSKSFSSLPRGTCSLSVSRPYLALDGIYRPIGAAFPNNPTRRQRLVVRQGPATTGLSPSLAPLSRELGPGPSLRTLLQTTIRTPKTSDFQAGLFPSFWTGTSDYMTRIKFTTACQDAPDVLSLDFGQPRAVTHGRSASVPYPREDGGTTICDTQADVPSVRRLGAQLAFKDSMVHGILQFPPSIAFRYVLHRCESRDIRCRESF